MSPDWEKEVPERYRVFYDKLTGAFKIIDCWHESVKSIPLDATITDDSPAIKILSSLEVNALLSMIEKMGWLEKFKGTGVVVEKVAPSKSVQEIAIENIARVIETASEESVTREAIIAIRELGGK